MTSVYMKENGGAASPRGAASPPRVATCDARDASRRVARRPRSPCAMSALPAPDQTAGLVSRGAQSCLVSFRVRFRQSGNGRGRLERKRRARRRGAPLSERARGGHEQLRAHGDGLQRGHRRIRGAPAPAPRSAPEASRPTRVVGASDNARRQPLLRGRAEDGRALPLRRHHHAADAEGTIRRAARTRAPAGASPPRAPLPVRPDPDPSPTPRKKGSWRSIPRNRR